MKNNGFSRFFKVFCKIWVSISSTSQVLCWPSLRRRRDGRAVQVLDGVWYVFAGQMSDGFGSQETWMLNLARIHSEEVRRGYLCETPVLPRNATLSEGSA